MKKHISLIGGLLTSTILIGCSETKILDENTKDNISEKYTITERNIENTDKDNTFIPLFYDEDLLYGRLQTKLSTNYVTHTNFAYYSDKDESIIELEEGKFTNEELDFMQNFNGNNGSGVYMIDSNKLSERKFYYMDVKNKIKFELKEFEKTYSSIEFKLKNFSHTGFKMVENNKYYIQQYFSTYNGSDIIKREFIIIDTETQKFYIDDNSKQFIHFFYDNNENSIMGIDKEGKIYKIIIQENKFTYEFYKDMELNGLKLYDKLGANIINVDDDIIITQVEDNEDTRGFNYYNVLYNYKTNEIIPLDKEKWILNKVRNTNYYIVLYKKVYLAELTNDGEINLIYKLDNDDGYKYMYSFTNDKGNNIFIARQSGISMDDGEKSPKPIEEIDIKYSILEIQER